jgi:hypothetical protein
METHRRGSDGRRPFTPEFQRGQLGRVLRDERHTENPRVRSSIPLLATVGTCGVMWS